MSEHQIFIFLVQVFLLLGLARLLGEVFNRFHQPALTAEIFVGIFLGPTLLGRFLPQVQGYIFPNDPLQQNMLETVAWLGAFFLLLETGLEIDFSSAWRQRGDALKIAIAGIVIPFVLSFALAWFLPEQLLVTPSTKLIFTLFMATVFTVSAMPITARALHDLNLSKTDLGFLIMSALSVNDIIGWLLFAVVFGFFVEANAQMSQTMAMFGGALVFVFLCLTWGRRLSNAVVDGIKQLKLPEPGSSLTFIFLLGVLCAAIAQKIGLNALFGFFLAGIVAGEAKGLSERTRQVISQMVYAIFVPLFFTSIGLKVDFFKDFDFFLVLFVTVVTIGVRFLGAWVGILFTKVPKGNRSVVAIAHTPGGMMEIVMGLLALQHHLITPKIFIAVVFGALITAVIMGPWLTFAVNRRRQVSVFEFFTRRGLVMPLKVATRDNAIEALSTVAAEEIHTYDAAAITAAVLERENLMGTAIEEGIAVPHARLEGLRKPVVIFARSLSGIEWNSPDGKPTQFIFLILTPLEDDNAQLQVLRAIAKVMLNPVNAKAILNAKDAGETWDIFQSAFTSLYVQKR